MCWRVVNDSPTPPTVTLLIVGLFVFFQLILMHKCVYTFVHSLDNIDSEVDDNLAPFFEGLDVQAYKEHLSEADILLMAKYFDLPSNDLIGLSKKLPEWSDCEGGIDSEGLFEIRRENPDGMWDWYIIGGRWDGYIHGKQAHHDAHDETIAIDNTLPVKQLEELDDALLQLRLPAVILTPDGDWKDQICLFSFLQGEEEIISDKLAELRKSLAEYPDHYIVCVDIHY